MLLGVAAVMGVSENWAEWEGGEWEGGEWEGGGWGGGCVDKEVRHGLGTPPLIRSSTTLPCNCAPPL